MQSYSMHFKSYMKMGRVCAVKSKPIYSEPNSAFKVSKIRYLGSGFTSSTCSVSFHSIIEIQTLFSSPSPALYPLHDTRIILVIKYNTPCILRK